MSEIQLKIECKECKHTNVVPFNTMILSWKEPEKKKSMMDGSFFWGKCSKCGARIPIVHDCFYFDNVGKYVVAYAGSEIALRNAYGYFYDYDAGAVDYLYEHDYMKRIVRTQLELKEKIHVFEDGMDDRIIELVKLYLFPNITERFGKARVFYEGAGGKKLIFTERGGKILEHIDISDNRHYNRLSSKYAKELIDIKSDGPEINRKWAVELVTKTKKGL